MAISVVQAAQNSVNAVAAVTVTISTSANNLLAIFTTQNINNTSTVTISDSAGQTWTQTTSGYASQSATSRSAVWIKPSSKAVTSVTATWSGGISARVDAIVFEISGAAASSAEDSSVNNSQASGTTATSGSLTTTNANDILIFGVHISGGFTSPVAGSGYTIPTNGSSARAAMQYQIVSAPQSAVTTTLSWTGAFPNDNVFAAFKAAVTVEADDGEQIVSQITALPSRGPFSLADDWLPRVPQPPLFEWDESQRWQLSRDAQVKWTTGEEDTGLLPVVPKIVYDDDTSRSFETRSKQDDEPWHTFFLIPQPPPNLGWDDWDWSLPAQAGRDFSPVYFKSPEAEPFDFPRPIVTPLAYDKSAAFFTGSYGSLAAMVAMDEFVSAPSGSITFGPAPTGRSVRFGFSIPSFR